MITPQHYASAAKRIGCEIAAIQAVANIEAPSGGFTTSGNLVILFEPHIFFRELKAAGVDPIPLVKQYQDLVSPTWNPKLYGPSSRQWDKLNRAIGIHDQAAKKSASYGKFQILGQNYRAAGYPNVDAMIADYRKGEEFQLDSFVNYILFHKLDAALRKKDWTTFARQYNGPSYKKNQYDNKMKKAYAKFNATP